MKPRLTLADAEAFRRACDLAYRNTPVMFGEQRAVTAGRLGEGILVFKIKGRNVHMRAGDPRLLTLKACD